MEYHLANIGTEEIIGAAAAIVIAVGSFLWGRAFEAGGEKEQIKKHGDDIKTLFSLIEKMQTEISGVKIISEGAKLAADSAFNHSNETYEAVQELRSDFQKGFEKFSDKIDAVKDEILDFYKGKK